MIFNILILIPILLGITGIILVTRFSIKIRKWKWCGYSETYRDLVAGKLDKIKDPSGMKFSNIENKMYHIGAYEAYCDYRSSHVKVKIKQ